MKRKYFVVSDIHGHFDELMNALDEAGFNKENELHRLIVCGDCFDRGNQSKEIYEWLFSLNEKVIVIKGNHDEFLEQFLMEDGMPQLFNYKLNGFDATLASFLEVEKPFENYSFYRYDNGDKKRIEDYFIDWQRETSTKLKKMYPQLFNWIKERPYYFETKNYIFTHGAIDTKIEDWHLSDWRECVWDKGTFFNESICNTNKTVVIGHFATRHLRHLYCGLSEEDFNCPEYNNSFDKILVRKDKRVIALDTCTTLTKKVNVCIIEDDEEIF